MQGNFGPEYTGLFKILHIVTDWLVAIAIFCILEICNVLRQKRHCFAWLATMAEERLEGARRALRTFLGKPDVSKFERFLTKMVELDYDDPDTLAVATTEGLEMCGLSPGLIDLIKATQGEEIR